MENAIKIGLDSLFVFESDSGRNTAVDKANSDDPTSGEYHIGRRIVEDYLPDGFDRNQYEEREVGRLLLTAMAERMKSGYSDIAPINIDYLEPNELGGVLSMTFNTGQYQPKLMKSLRLLAKARQEGRSEEEIMRYKKMAAGFMDVVKSKGEEFASMARRRLAEQDLFMNNTPVMHPATMLEKSGKDKNYALGEVDRYRESSQKSLDNHKVNATNRQFQMLPEAMRLAALANPT